MRGSLAGTGLLSAAIVGLLTLGVSGKEKDFNATCPVAGKPAIEKCTSKYAKDKNVYFCCGNCKKKFDKDSKPFAAKANFQLAQTGQVTQVACPFTGKDCNPDATVDVDGVSVAFCCNGCKGKANKADDKVALVFAKIGKGYTTQTKCPVSGKPIDVTKSTEHEGRKVYFCCDGCPKAFDKDPAKFAAKLPAKIE